MLQYRYPIKRGIFSSYIDEEWDDPDPVIRSAARQVEKCGYVTSDYLFEESDVSPFVAHWVPVVSKAEETARRAGRDMVQRLWEQEHRLAIAERKK